MAESLWTRVADLPLTVDAHAIDRLEAPAPAERVTYLVRLRGGDAEGLGEDVGGDMLDEKGAFLAAAASLALAGEWTLATFFDHLAGLDLWPEPAFATVGRRLERYPGLRFKLDAQASWSPSLAAEVAATGAVEVIDFKGRYELPVEDEFALLAMYEAVLDRFADAILEDPHDRPDVAARLEPHAARVSFDAPIATAADIAAAPFGARIVNVKPSRIGGVRALLDIYEHCERNGVRMYGGGMGELGVARGQIELLAALFHPDGPNDVAPSAYNLTDLPPGLPESPLTPPTGITGFRWA
jgi:hypothetical protein